MQVCELGAGRALGSAGSRFETTPALPRLLGRSPVWKVSATILWEGAAILFSVAAPASLYQEVLRQQNIYMQHTQRACS